MSLIREPVRRHSPAPPEQEPWFVPPGTRGAVRPQRTQPPRSCDRCGRPQSIYRRERETLCAPCQRRSPAPSDYEDGDEAA